MPPSRGGISYVVCTGLEPGLTALRLFGQVRNTRLASLPLALLVYSPRFRLASSPTGRASAPRPIAVSHLLDIGPKPLQAIQKT